MKHAVVVLALLVLVPTVAAAAGCDDVLPHSYTISMPQLGCSNEVACKPDQPLVFALQAGHPRPDLSCATVTWDYGDGTPPVTVNGSQVVTHAYTSIGFHDVTMTITTPRGSQTTTFPLGVANDIVSFYGWASIERDGEQLTGVFRKNPVGPLTFSWTVRRDDGSVPDDVTPTDGSITLSHGDSDAFIPFRIIDDAVNTGTRIYRFTGTVDAPDVLVWPAMTIGIDEDDFAKVAMPIEPMSIREDQGPAVVRVVRSGLTDVRAEVDYYTESVVGDPGRIDHVNGTLIFEPGQTEQTFTVPIYDNSVWTADSVISLGLQPRPGSPVTRIVRSFMALRIHDDEPAPAYAIQAAPVIETNRGTHAVVTLTAPAPGPARFRYRTISGTATAGSDFTSANGSIFFHSMTETIRIPIRGDDDAEDDETFRIEFSHEGPRTLPLPPPITITILNDDAGLTPDILRVPRGGKASMLLVVGSNTTTPITATLTNSRPDLVRIPSSVIVPAGESRVRFDVEGLAASTTVARITAGVAGFGTVAAAARVYERMQLTFDPATVHAHAGDETIVQVKVTPAPAAPLEIPLAASGNVVSLPPSVTIATDGTGAFTLRAIERGATRIHASLPDGDTALLDVTVSDAANAPLLQSIAPTSGALSGGTAFVARGAHLRGDCTLTFGGQPATGVTLTGDALHGLTPPHAAGAVDVVLTCGTSTSTLPNAFAYVDAPPTIESISPPRGSIRGGTLVRATGTAFSSGCWMFFHGIPATHVDVDSASSMTAEVPAFTAGGIVDTTIRCGTHAPATLPASFAYLLDAEPGATIASIAPATAAPGETLTITGSRFRRDSLVHIGGEPATILRARGEQLDVRVPEIGEGTVSVIVDHVTGPNLTVLAPLQPRIDAVSPRATLRNSDVVVTGRGFRPVHAFSIGGKPAHVISLDYEKVVLRIAHDAAPGTHPILLGGTDSGVQLHVGTSRTRIDGVTPPCGTTSGGAEVVIELEWAELPRAVFFNGIAANFEHEFELRAVVPPGVTGNASVRVQTQNDDVILTDAFRYVSVFDPAGCGSGRTRAARH